ncbi:MAG: glycosyltransferase family 39 protein [Anaerolineae bacterium]|nr:glycosyltransferase family 39 protein [Anaerolineae bacterium]
MERSGFGHYYVVAVALIILAFGLRVWGLTATSLWYDETFVLYHAQQGVIDGTLGLLREDNALPLHGLLLALWINVAGGGEFAARYLSVLLGTIAAALVLRLGSVVIERRYGGWGAALAYVTLPIYVYYAQEVRMYALVVPLAAGFAWMSWRIVERGRGVPAYVILGTAMMLAHLYAGLLWAAVLVWGSYRLQMANGKWRIANHASRIPSYVWWRANLWLCLAVLPIAAWGLWRARVDATAVSAIPTEALRWIPVLFGVGQYLPRPWDLLFIAITVLALAAALAGLWRARRVDGMAWLLITLILPVVLLLAATFVKAKWSERYLLPSFGLALVIGVGVGWESLVVSRKSKRQCAAVESRKSRITHHVSRVCGALLLTVWLALAAPALARQAQGTWAVGIIDEWHPRPDFRGVARYIEARDTPDDAIVVIGGYAAYTLDYYYDGPARLFGLPFDKRVLDTQHPLDLHALATLEQQTWSAQRLWLVLWQDTLADPTRLVVSHLIEACHRLPVDTHLTNVGVILFDLTTCHPLDRLAVPPHPLAVDFTEPIRVTGYDLIKTDETWEVDIWWETYGPLPTNYLVFVHLIGPDSVLVAQHDHIAGTDAYPTSQWVVGTMLRDRFFLNVPGGVCNQCTLQVGLYTEEGRLSLRDGGDTMEIGVGD